MSGSSSRELVLREIKSIRVGPNQQLRQVQVPENAYVVARNFLQWAPNFSAPDYSPVRFKKLCYLSDNENIYDLLITDAGETSLQDAGVKLQDWQAAIKALLRYALNLLLAPNRPEFLRMKLSTSFYVYQVAKKLKEAEKILVCMGYECTSAGRYEVQEYKYKGEVKTDHVAEVVTDLVILHCELEQIQVLVQDKIRAGNKNVKLYNILATRAPRTEDQDQRAALQLSAWEAQRHDIVPVRNNPQMMDYNQYHHSSPPLLAQHTSTGRQYHMHRQQPFLQAPGAAHQQQHYSTAPQPQRGIQNVSTFQNSPSSQLVYGYPQQNLPQQQSDQYHQSVYQNTQYAGAQAMHPSHSTQYQSYENTPNPDVKYRPNGKGLNKDISKPVANVGARAYSKDHNYKALEKYTEQRPHSESKPPDPLDLPEPVVPDNKMAPVQHYHEDTYDDNVSYLIDPRSVQSDMSGPNLDSMLSDERSLNSMSHPGLCENVSETSYHSAERTPVECSHRREPQNAPYYSLEIREGEPPAHQDDNTQAISHHREPQKLNSQKASDAQRCQSEASSSASKKPVPKPRQKPTQTPKIKTNDKQYTSQTVTPNVHDQEYSMISTETTSRGDQSGETEQLKPHSSPHPSMENDSAPASIDLEPGLPGSGPQSTEDPSILSQDVHVDIPVDNKGPKPRDRSNAIVGTSTDTEKTSTEVMQSSQLYTSRDKTWVCSYCTNINTKRLCDICSHERPLLKETTV